MSSVESIIGKDVARVFESELNEEERKVEVINMGAGNYDSSMQLELFKKKGLDFDPDMVILVHFVNDVEPTPRISKTLHFLKSQSYLYAVISGKYLNFVSKFSKDLHLENYYSSIYQEGSDNLLANTQALEEFVSLTSRGEVILS